MFAIARSLVWKEWREQRWRIVTLTGIVLFISTWFAVGGRITVFEAAIPALYMVLPFAVMFLAMSAAASEQSGRTVGFLQALPISPAKFGVTKLVGSLITLLCPLAVIYVIFLGAGGSEEGPKAADLGPWGIVTTWRMTLLITAAGLVSLFLWAATFAVNQRDEIRAGAIGFLAVSLVWISITVVPMAFVDDPEFLPGWKVLVAGAPGGPLPAAGYVNRSEFEDYGPPLIWGILIHILLAAWFVARYSRISRGGVKPADATAHAAGESIGWLAPPRRSKLSALVWKQVRESVPLAILGAALIVVISAIIFRYAATNSPADEPAIPILAWYMIGMFLMLVAGIGAFMEDYQLGVSGFWRSRPIPLRTYFAVKYFGGLIATTLILLSAVLLTLAISCTWRPLSPKDFFDSFAPASFGVVWQWGIYTAAAAGFVLTRNALAAAVFAVVSIFIVSIAIGYLGANLPPRWSTFAALSAAPIIAGALLAYHAFRNDWGWRK